MNQEQWHSTAEIFHEYICILQFDSHIGDYLPSLPVYDVHGSSEQLQGIQVFGRRIKSYLHGVK